MRWVPRIDLAVIVPVQSSTHVLCAWYVSAEELCEQCEARAGECASVDAILSAKALKGKRGKPVRVLQRRHHAYDRCARRLGIQPHKPLPACCDLSIKHAFPGGPASYEPYKAPPGIVLRVSRLGRCCLTPRTCRCQGACLWSTSASLTSLRLNARRRFTHAVRTPSSVLFVLPRHSSIACGSGPL